MSAAAGYPALRCADTPIVDQVDPSPNFEPRRMAKRPTILLLHYTGMRSADDAIRWLANPVSKVSCHYVVDEGGRITQMVAEDMRAWHAGAAFWAGETDINSASIGIEIHNRGHGGGYPDFTEAQMSALEVLSRDIVQRHRILPARVLAHSDVSPSRKVDPGEKFDWRRLATAGAGLWVEPVPLDLAEAGVGLGDRDPIVGKAQALLASYGYGVPRDGLLDETTSFVLRAFQLHFRPARPDGRLDRSTLATIERLVAASSDSIAS